MLAFGELLSKMAYIAYFSFAADESLIAFDKISPDFFRCWRFLHLMAARIVCCWCAMFLSNAQRNQDDKDCESSNRQSHGNLRGAKDHSPRCYIGHPASDLSNRTSRA